ncbi:MAG: hypothetical protein WD989_02125 [Candidatus Paceibacterota bacterium]
MLTAFVVFTVLYLKLSLVCLPIMVAVAIYDTRRYPLCSGCGHNLLTRRPRFFGQLAKCRRHGWIVA